MMRLSLPIFPSLVFSPPLLLWGTREERGDGDFQNQFPGEQSGRGCGLYWVNIAISIYRPRPFSGLLKTLSFHSLSDAFFFFFLSDISACNWKSPVPSPAISDRSHTMITRQSKYHRARGRIVRFEGLLCIRLRGNKGCVSLSCLERNSSRAKSQDKSSRLSPLIYCESYLEGRGEGLAHLHLELS